MLGMIHKVVLKKAPPQFSEFIYPAPPRNEPRGWKAARGHNKQLHDPIDGTRSSATQRSVLGMIHTYNLLPQTLVDISSVNAFQRKLQNGLKV